MIFRAHLPATTVLPESLLRKMRLNQNNKVVCCKPKIVTSKRLKCFVVLRETVITHYVWHCKRLFSHYTESFDPLLIQKCWLQQTFPDKLNYTHFNQSLENSPSVNKIHKCIWQFVSSIDGMKMCQEECLESRKPCGYFIEFFISCHIRCFRLEVILSDHIFCCVWFLLADSSDNTHFSLLSSAWLPFLLTFLDIFNGCRINYNDNDIIIVFYCNQDLNVTWAGYMLSVSTAFSYFESLSWHVSCSTVKLKAWENKISEMQETFVETCSHS